MIQSWLSAYVVRDFIYFYANVQLMKRDIHSFFFIRIYFIRISRLKFVKF